MTTPEPIQPEPSPKPRRFARMFEFNRNDEYAGTSEQQASVRGVFDKYIQYGNPLDQLLGAIDKDRGKKGLSYSPITFTDLGEGKGGYTSGSRIILNSRLVEVERVLLHELGHVVGMNLDKNYDRSEGWANLFMEWVVNGMSVDDPVWKVLEPYMGKGE